MTTEGEGRAVALQKYKIFAGVMGLLSAGLLIIGIIAVTKYPEGSFGPPYFIGCFVVGCLVYGHYILSMFLFMCCCVGTIFAAMGGLGGSSLFDEKTGYEDQEQPEQAPTLLLSHTRGAYKWAGWVRMPIYKLSRNKIECFKRTYGSNKSCLTSNNERKET
ncbi:hypothetical protein MAR_020804, partial [Mya arenaria]